MPRRARSATPIRRPGEAVEQSILGGGAKLQWKVDWAMRWVALGVDYEMSGKDLIDCGHPELEDRPHPRRPAARGLQLRAVPRREWREDLQDQGQRRHHRRMADLRARGEPRFLSSTASRGRPSSFSFGIIPKAVDEYQQFLAAYPAQEWDKRLGNPVHHVHAGKVPAARMPLTFALLLNLVGVASTDDKDLLWGFVKRYAPEASPETHPELDALIGHAARLFPRLRRRTRCAAAPPTRSEAAALRDLDSRAREMPTPTPSAEDIQNEVYEVGKAAGFENLRDWFQALYETLLGTSQGPRMGSFIALYGIDNSRKLIAEALAAKGYCCVRSGTAGDCWRRRYLRAPAAARNAARAAGERGLRDPRQADGAGPDRRRAERRARQRLPAIPGDREADAAMVDRASATAAKLAGAARPTPRPRAAAFEALRRRANPQRSRSAARRWAAGTCSADHRDGAAAGGDAARRAQGAGTCRR